MNRIKHWATRGYHSFLLERAQMPFAWGKHDCALFAADGIQAITGTDIAAAFRGKYTDEASAMKVIKEITRGSTVGDAAAWCAEQFGLKEWTHAAAAPGSAPVAAPRYAQRGDLVVFNAPAGGLVAGLVHLSGQIVAVGEKGLYNFPISKAVRAWRI